MKQWCRLVGFWLLMDVVLLSAAPGRVQPFLAFKRYLGGTHGTGLRITVIASFLFCAALCFIAAQLDRGKLIPLALSVAFTWTLIWAALGLLVAIAGYGDYGRMTLYSIWLYIQAERLRYAWVELEDEQQVRALLRRLRVERRQLERNRRQTMGSGA